MDVARLEAQLLAGPPAASVLDVAERLLAVQAQDGRAARLAVRARTRGLGASDVDRALGERELLITWLNRGTLHLVRVEDYPWLQALTAPTTVTANERRLGQEGVSLADADRAVAEVECALADEGPLTRDQLRARIDAIGVRTERQALVHILLRASLRGLIVRGPMADGDHAFVLVRDWLGEQPAVDRDVALAELARRFLVGHGPADERDLARWAGLGLRDVRAGLEAIAGELVEQEDGTVALAQPPRGGVERARGGGTGPTRGGTTGRARGAAAGALEPAAGAAKLLGGFDPVLFGWVDRTPLLGDNQGVITMNGIFKPIALVRGKAVATWTMPKGEVELAPFGRLAKTDRDALDLEGEDVRRFLNA